MTPLAHESSDASLMTAEEERAELLAMCDRVIAESRILSAESSRKLIRHRSAAKDIPQPLGSPKPR
jgi:hypothetical protein